MKKIVSIILGAAVILALCSCGKNEVGSYKEPENYKKASSAGYTISYDNNTFAFVKADGFDYIILKSKQETAPNDYDVTITKVEGKTVDEYAKEVENRFEEKGYTEVSADPSQALGEKALCVSALANEGETVHEAEIVPFDGGVYELYYHYSTSLDDVAVSDTIYSMIATFKLK